MRLNQVLASLVLIVGAQSSEGSSIIGAEDSGASIAPTMGEFQIEPKVDLVTSSSNSESVSSHSGTVLTENGHGSSDSAANDDGNNIDDTIYDKEKHSGHKKSSINEHDPYEWWTSVNLRSNLNFFSSFNPS